MTAVTALVEENQPGRPTNVCTIGSPQLSATSTFVQRLSMSGTDRSLVPWIDRRIKCQQQESFTLTLPTIPQFNLTKIEHNRLTVRCLLRTISYETSVFDHTTDLHEISCSKAPLVMSRRRHLHINAGI